MGKSSKPDNEFQETALSTEHLKIVLLSFLKSIFAEILCMPGMLLRLLCLGSITMRE